MKKGLLKPRCGWCKHFTSYEDLFEDPLEDSDCGICGKKEEDDQFTTAYNICKEWEARNGH